MHVVPVEAAAGVAAERVLRLAVLVLLPAVPVLAEALAARPQRALEPAVVVVAIVCGVEEEGGEGGVDVEEEEGPVGRVEGGEHGLERGVVLRRAGVGQRVAARVVDPAREDRRAPHRVQVRHHHLLHPGLVPQPPQLLPELPHHRRDVRDRSAGAVVVVAGAPAGGVGVVVAGDDDERSPRVVVVVVVAAPLRPSLQGLEEVDLGADVALEVAGVEHAGAAHGEVHAAREHPGARAPAHLVGHRRRHSHRRGDEVGEDAAVGEATGGAAREGLAVGVVPGVRELPAQVAQVARVRVRVPKHPQLLLLLLLPLVAAATTRRRAPPNGAAAAVVHGRRRCSRPERRHRQTEKGGGGHHRREAPARKTMAHACCWLPRSRPAWWSLFLFLALICLVSSLVFFTRWRGLW